MFCRYKKQLQKSYEDVDEGDSSKLKPTQFQGQEFDNAAELYKNIVQGNLYAQCPNLSKVIRIFTSSTFTDTKHERNRLMVDVYPKLKSFCRQVGLEFQVVDMRWGVRFETVDDHKTTELCLAEIDNCNKLSRGPTFVTFLSHKYGYRPFPREISADEFDKIVGKLDKLARALFNKWFRLDINAVPPAYVLQSISSVIDGYSEDATPADKKKFGKIFWDECETMQEALLTAVAKVLPASQMEKYFMSVTESEIQEGLIKARNPKAQCLWFCREIVDIADQPDSDLLRRFRESAEGDQATSQGIRDRLEKLKTEKIPAVLPPENIVRYRIHWSPNGIDPDLVPEHKAYLDRLCAEFEVFVKLQISRSLLLHQGDRGAKIASSPLVREICQHARFAQTKAGGFFGRGGLISRLAGYLDRPAAGPLVCHGVSGCGKTSLMAKLAFAMLDKHKGSDGGACVLVRFLGTTQASSTLREVLSGLVNQCRRILGASKDSANGQSVKTLAAAVVVLLKRLATTRPVLVVLDSIDQLKPDDSAHSCFWMPKTLPDNVWWIVSTLPKEYGILENLKIMYNFDTHEGAKNFVEVTQLDSKDSKAILREHLRSRNRILTPKQQKLLEACVARVALPLYAKLCVDFAAKWGSFSTVSEESLAPTVRQIISQLFLRVEKKHGELLVRRALGYLTVSSAGLSENELEDVLALDDDVLNDTFEYWVPPLRRLPPLAINRVMFELQDYLVEQGSEGVPTLRWYHRQFLEAAVDRFCSDEAAKTRLHSLTAEFFTGVWAATPKPYVDLSAKGTGKEGAALRYVPDQPIRFEGGEYNRRKLVELPHHLLLSGNLSGLKSECLISFNFLHALITAKGVDNCIDVFRAATETYPDDPELNALGSFFSQSHQALVFEPDLLPVQLLTKLTLPANVGQLTTVLLTDALSAGHCKTYLPLELLRPASSSGGGGGSSGGRPSPLRLRPGPQHQLGLQFSLAKHRKSVVALAVTKDFGRAVTVGEDNAVSFWDLNKGSCLRTVQLAEDLDPVVQFVNDDKDVVVPTASGFVVLQFGSGVFVRTFKRSDGLFGLSSQRNTKSQRADRLFFHPIRSGRQLVVFGTTYLHILDCSDWSEVGRIDLAHCAAAAANEKVFTASASLSALTPIAGIDKYLLVVEPELEMSIYQFDLKALQFVQHRVYFRERTEEETDAGESDESISGLYINRDEVQCVFIETDKCNAHFCQLPSLEVVKVVSLSHVSPGFTKSHLISVDQWGRQWANDRFLVTPGTCASKPCVSIWDSWHSSRAFCCEHSPHVSINAIRVDASMQRIVTVGSDACLNLFDRSKEVAAAEPTTPAAETASDYVAGDQAPSGGAATYTYNWRDIFPLSADERYVVYYGQRIRSNPSKQKETDSYIVVYDVLEEKKVREFCMPTKRCWTVTKYNEQTLLIEHNRKGYLLDLLAATVTVETQGVTGGTANIAAIPSAKLLAALSRGQRSLKLHSTTNGKARIALKDVFGPMPKQVISELLVTPGGRYIVMCDEDKLNRFVCYDLNTSATFELKDGVRKDLSLYDAFATHDDELLVTLLEARVGPTGGRLRNVTCLTVWSFAERAKLRVLFDQEFADKAMGKMDEMDTLYYARIGPRLIVTGHDDGHLRIWHLDQDRPLTRLKAHEHQISGVSSSGQQAATGPDSGGAVYFVSVCDDDAEMSFKCWSVTVTASSEAGGLGCECSHLATYKLQEPFKQLIPLHNGTRVLTLTSASDEPYQLLLMDSQARARIWAKPEGPKCFQKMPSPVSLLTLFDGNEFPRDPTDPDSEEDRPEDSDDDSDGDSSKEK